MSETSLNLLTKRKIESDIDPLSLIWSLDHWVSALRRVKSLEILSQSPTKQHFILHFDADRPELDIVEVERTFSENCIHVIHRRPPPNISSLCAKWWIDPKIPKILYVCRQIVMDEQAYSPQVACKMFRLLKENMTKLLGQEPCAINE